MSVCQSAHVKPLLRELDQLPVGFQVQWFQLPL